MTVKTPPPYIVIAGATASGKSRLGLELAAALGGEIVNCDSVQLYRGFDIGSAKATAAERALVTHHLLDVVGWDEGMDAAQFANLARGVIAEVASRGRLPIVVGGSGLYLRSLWGESFHDLPSDAQLRAQLKARPPAELYAELCQRDPERAQAIHPHDSFRVARALEIILLSGKSLAELTKEPVVPFAPRCLILLEPPREELHAAIAERCQAMLEAGLIAEVEGLLASGCPASCRPMQSIGYRQVADYLSGALAREELVTAISAATRQYAKRQMTWFRKLPVQIHLRQRQSGALLASAVKAYIAEA